MSPKYLVEVLKKIVQEQSVKDTIESLKESYNNNQQLDDAELAKFFNKLSPDDKESLIKILNQSTEMVLFGVFCVLDGVRAIESGEDKGSLELWYRKGEMTMLLNDPDDEYLHDLMW